MVLMSDKPFEPAFTTERPVGTTECTLGVSLVITGIVAASITHSTTKQAIRTKKEYIGKIKKHLENDFLYPTDDLEIFNEQEKKESGGYDAMIVYQSKRFFKEQLIQILKDSNTRP